jgi:peptidoglycan/LPS O-acetylase OafA/YrhL
MRFLQFTGIRQLPVSGFLLAPRSGLFGAARLVFGLSGHIRIPEKMQSVLAHAGRRTYEIYLVHWPLKNLLYYNGVFDDISRKISGLGSGWLYNITREVLLILLVLAVSVPVAELIVLAGRLAGGLFRKKTA